MSLVVSYALNASLYWLFYFFFFQAEDGIRDVAVTGVQTCALPISSPESETRPANAERAGSVSSALAVRSSSHEAITLPRRQTSAMSRMLKSYWYSSGLRSGVVSASTACSDLPTLA